MSDNVLAIIEVSQPRRWIGVGMHYFIGLLLIYLGWFSSLGVLFKMMLICLGFCMFWAGKRMYNATTGWLEFTENGLFNEKGEVVVLLKNIVGIDRGIFAFKPSNGFLITLKSPNKFSWEPGLWWRIGRRLGVGGVTHVGQAKVVADLISIKLKRLN
ncbi:MAG: hypothetical protein OXC62_00250 [Aestuariivita sp.]|nr:hypothetical protein [Aestuariivita sp.]